MRNRSPRDAERLVKRFETKGFVESFSNQYLLNILRERYNQYFKVFDAGCKISAGRLTKYGAYTYYYDKRREKQFVDFLVNNFYTQNPDPDSDLRSSFTRILHIHGLCWGGCVFHNSIIAVRKFKDEIKRRYNRYNK